MKRWLLQQYVASQNTQPLAMALQETRGVWKLSGYKSYDSGKGSKTQVVTYVKNNVAVVQHEVGNRETETVFVEILTGKKNRGSIFLLNVYSSPKCTKARFGPIFKRAISLAGKNPLIIAGDFNARHREWGYTTSSPKGQTLLEDITESNLYIANDIRCPTRVGNSVSADTNPDLTLCHRTGIVKWTNKHQDLGSDHYVLEVELSRKVSVKRAVCRTETQVDWDKFRQIREREEIGDIECIQNWAAQLITHVNEATEEIKGEALPEAMDSRLFGMFKKKEELTKKLKKQKWNRNLRREIARHNVEIEKYARKLESQRWDNKCDEMEGTMNGAKTWQLLRFLIDPTKSKTVANIEQVKARYNFKGTDKQLIDKLKSMYVAPPATAHYRDYNGPANSELDASITVAEVRAELHGLKRRSAPGPDLVNNKMLANLDDESINALTKYLNQVWESGQVPQEWKRAKITLIHKQGKPPGLENLRPISLTSCVGKLLEKVIQRRLTKYTEENDAWPAELVGFRPGLCTQDTMLRLHNDVVRDFRKKNTKAILGLDLKKAFDNVSHDAILDGLAELRVGERTYNYIRSFLRDRTAIISFQAYVRRSSRWVTEALRRGLCSHLSFLTS